MAWTYLVLAIILEVSGTVNMKLSKGFSVPGPSAAIFLFYGLSLFCLTMALRSLEVSVAYAVWSGLGTAMVALIGVTWFDEPMSAAKALCIALIIGGVVGLNLIERA